MLDTSLWVDFVRPGTPPAVRAQVQAFMELPDAATCEPIRFELFRAVAPRDQQRLTALFDTLPLLSTPSDLWERATQLGAKCTAAGHRPPAVDLLIAAICLHHKSTLVTFDVHFSDIARLAPLKLNLLPRGRASVSERRARYKSHR